MDRELVQLVRSRARGRCEYCHFPEQFAEAPFQLDHIVARKHGGATSAENLALACYHCNSYKGTDLSGIDPHTGRIVRLFHPRKDHWPRHFQLQDDRIIGLTAIGRATIHVLWLNHPLAVEARRWLRELS